MQHVVDLLVFTYTSATTSKANFLPGLIETQTQHFLHHAVTCMCCNTLKYRSAQEDGVSDILELFSNRYIMSDRS